MKFIGDRLESRGKAKEGQEVGNFWDWIKSKMINTHLF